MGLKEFFQKQQANIKAADERNQERVREKAERDLEKARTDSAKEVVKQRREQELLKLKRDASEAKIATNKAKIATQKAKDEANDVGGVRDIFKIKAAPAKAKAKPKRKAAKRRAAPKKRTKTTKAKAGAKQVVTVGTYEQTGPSAAVLSKERAKVSRAGNHTRLHAPTRTSVITPKRPKLSR